MIALELVAETFSTVGRFLFRLISEVLIEFLCKGMGYVLWKPFKPAVNPKGSLTLVTGFIFWLFVFFAGYQAYAFIGIDSCLDAGGSYNYQTGFCEK